MRILACVIFILYINISSCWSYDITSGQKQLDDIHFYYIELSNNPLVNHNPNTLLNTFKKVIIGKNFHETKYKLSIDAQRLDAEDISPVNTLVINISAKDRKQLPNLDSPYILKVFIDGELHDMTSPFNTYSYDYTREESVVTILLESSTKFFKRLAAAQNIEVRLTDSKFTKRRKYYASSKSENIKALKDFYFQTLSKR